MKQILTYRGVVMPRDCNASEHMSMTQYIDKFEQAGRRFFLEMGVVPHQNPNEGIVAIEQQTKYLREAYESDLLDIKSTLVDIGNKAFTIFHEMYNARTKELISTMRIVFTLFDQVNKKAKPFPIELKKALLNQRDTAL